MFAFAFSSGRAENILLKAAIFLGIAVSCVACGGTGGASAMPPAPGVVASPTASPTPVAITERGIVAAVNIYGSKNPMVKLDKGSPYEDIDVYMNGAQKFKVGQKVRATGTDVNSPPNNYIIATSIVVVSASPTPEPSDTPTPRSTPTPTPRSTPTPTPRSTPTPTSAPGAVDHIFVIMMENNDRSHIVGYAGAPYINNTLLPHSADMTQSYGITHPSEPNYQALYSGSTQGIANDDCPLTYAARSLGGELGGRLRWYAEDMQGVGNPACWQGAIDADGHALYARKHVVMFNFSDTPASDGVPYTNLASDLANNTVPKVAFISPNMCDDMHDACGGDSIAHGDTWLTANLPRIEAYANMHNGLVIVTWDEDDYGSGQIATFFTGPMIKNGSYGEHINHYNVLATICQKLGLSNLGSSPITDIFK